MATNVIRTVTDDATDALAAIRDAELELTRMRQHIERTTGQRPEERRGIISVLIAVLRGSRKPSDSASASAPDPRGFVYQALHSGDIVEARVGDALRHTRAMRRALLGQDA